MKNKFTFLILLLVFLYVTPVFASNTIDYTLTITDDYEFKEVISYRIEDYKSPKNGYNYMIDIIDKDVYADIFAKSVYSKKKELKNDVYYVTLSKTFNEYTMSNSAFLNNCFQNPKYVYDVDKYSFSNTGDFNCMDADNLKITIITDFEVTSTNANKVDNKYVWNPTGPNFTMNISINKKYTKSESLGPTDNIIEEDNDNSESIEENKIIENEKEKHHINKYVALGIVGVVLITGLGAVIVLKSRSNSLNKI